MTRIFVILLSQDGFASDCPEIKFRTTTFYRQFEKVNTQNSIAELWTVISNQMIKYQLVRTRFDQISDNKHRSSRSMMFFKIVLLKNFPIFTGKHLCWSLFLIKLKMWRPVTLLKRDSIKVFSREFCEQLFL